MSKLTLHAGEDVGKAAQRFIDARERAERGEDVESETHVTFESWAGLAAVLSPKRVELLRHVHRHPAATVADLARALGRDYKRVREDVDVLAAAGLIERTADGVRADYDEIRTAIAL
ncbi:MarR family transcriptional regulator [Azospirillum halopraeferens]|uniref:HVO_A0114 family putative DNA-binding protein n=1 Tax=Azospirillum halopraeferens TaxID=34010 RepID=UPI0004147ADB|nr:MarR family transcriptional regulator [Azospirillum halopraeferens]